MSNLNNFTVVGRLTQEPKHSILKGQISLCEFSLANNYYSGESKPKGVNYFNFLMFGKKAETTGKYLTKGMLIAIVAEVREERWVDTQGNQKNRVRFIVKELFFLESRKDSNYTNYQEETKKPYKKESTDTQGKLGLDEPTENKRSEPKTKYGFGENDTLPTDDFDDDEDVPF